MNRREFMLSGGAGAIALTVLSPLNLMSQAIPLVDPASPQFAIAAAIWLRRFNQSSSSFLLSKRRFRLLVESSFEGMRAPFWFDKDIFRAMQVYMRIPGTVSVQHNRYVTITGYMALCAANRALLWIDSNPDTSMSSVPRAVLTVIDVGSDARHIWIVNNHPGSSHDSYDIPANLRLNIARWIRSHKPYVSEGGLLQKFTNLDRAMRASKPTLEVYGIPKYRCETALGV